MALQSNLDRRVVIAKDVADQGLSYPYVFFLGDGPGVNRAYMIDSYHVYEKYIVGFRGSKPAVITPFESDWRIVDATLFEFPTGSEMERKEVTDFIGNRDNKKKLVEEFGLEDATLDDARQSLLLKKKLQAIDDEISPMPLTGNASHGYR